MAKTDRADRADRDGGRGLRSCIGAPGGTLGVVADFGDAESTAA